MARPQIGPKIAAVYEMQSVIMEPRLKQQGIRWTTFQLLVTVSALGDQATQAEVGRRLGIAPPTLTESVQAHTQKGLLQQVPCPTDKRAKVLRLTHKGRQLIGSIRTIVKQTEDLLQAGLSEKQAAQLSALLDKAILALEKSPGQ